MKLTLQHVNVRSTESLDSMVEKRIFQLEPRVKIDEARVRLEELPEHSPAFRVHIYIVTPGPDLEVEARDHTIRAAFEKAAADLETTVQLRRLKPLRRVRSNLQSPARWHANRA